MTACCRHSEWFGFFLFLCVHLGGIHASGQTVTGRELARSFERVHQFFDDVKFGSETAGWIYDDANGKKWTGGKSMFRIWRRNNDCRSEGHVSQPYFTSSGKQANEEWNFESVFVKGNFVLVKMEPQPGRQRILSVHFSSRNDAQQIGFLARLNDIRSHCDRIAKARVEKRTDNNGNAYHVEWTEKRGKHQTTNRIAFSRHEELPDTLVPVRYSTVTSFDKSDERSPSDEEIQQERGRAGFPRLPMVSQRLQLRFEQYATMGDKVVPLKIQSESVWEYAGGVNRRITHATTNMDVEFNWQEDPIKVFAISASIPNGTSVGNMDAEGLPLVWQDGKVTKAIGLDQLASVEASQFSDSVERTHRWRTPVLLAGALLATIVLAFAWRFVQSRQK